VTIVPDTERDALAMVMRQTERDLGTAHEQICHLQGLNPAEQAWPEWSPQANTLRWFAAIREKFGIEP
jgi:hypothetical protein